MLHEFLLTVETLLTKTLLSDMAFNQNNQGKQQEKSRFLQSPRYLPPPRYMEHEEIDHNLLNLYTMPLLLQSP